MPTLRNFASEIKQQNNMEVSFVISVALGVAIVMVVLGLVFTLIYYRWRVSDNNVHLEKFINENMEMREKLRQAGEQSKENSE